MNDSANLLWQIVFAGHRIEERLESALEQTGLSLAKFGALRHLAEASQPLALSQLAEKIACVKSNVTQLVDRLENDGLVRRIPDPNDRRSILAAITDDGRTRFEAGAAVLAQAQQELLSDLPAEQRAAVAMVVSNVGGSIVPR
jgi:DNA-binding MarR family transcriptional regulator